MGKILRTLDRKLSPPITWWYYFRSRITHSDRFRFAPFCEIEEPLKASQPLDIESHYIGTELCFESMVVVSTSYNIFDLRRLLATTSILACKSKTVRETESFKRMSSRFTKLDQFSNSMVNSFRSKTPLSGRCWMSKTAPKLKNNLHNFSMNRKSESLIRSQVTDFLPGKLAADNLWKVNRKC
jgi:hypothetical protein